MQHISRFAATLLVMTILAGCATEQHARNDPCPPNHTLVCSDRMDHDQECRCHSKATLRDIFDLRHSR